MEGKNRIFYLMKAHQRFINVRKSGRNILFDYDRGTFATNSKTRYHRGLRLLWDNTLEVGIRKPQYKMPVYITFGTLAHRGRLQLQQLDSVLLATLPKNLQNHTFTIV